MFNSKFSRIIIIICTVVFAVLCFSIAQDHFEENRIAAEMEQRYNKVNEQINSLYIKRDRLTEEIETIRDELRSEDGGNLATVTFLLSEPDKELAIATKKHFDSYSVKANIVVSMDAFPGEEGFINADEAHALTDAGWEICAAVSTGREITNLNNRLGEAKLPKATSVLVKDTKSINAIKEQMKSQGIEVMFADPKMEIEEDESLVRIPLQGYRTAGIKDQTVEAINNSETVGLAVGPKGREATFIADPYDETVFASMMSIIGQYIKSGDCKATAAAEAGRRYKVRNANLARANAKAGSSIGELEKEIESINTELQNIHKD
ncbi:MAG: hypothetical protein KBS79_05030 [Lachnospiraceae bacterium]|nr:hypothetical protein [Candidatus Minthocola equi]